MKSQKSKIFGNLKTMFPSKIILTILALMILTACKPETTTQTTNATAQQIITLFNELDQGLNTSWKTEEIPTNMIKLDAIEGWTAQMTFQQSRLANTDNKALKNLIDARIAMLKAQVAYYLISNIGENGTINMTIKGENATVTQQINCENVNNIAKSISLYETSFNEWKKFYALMDDALQSAELRNAIGATQQNRIKFYNSPFKEAKTRIDTTVSEVYRQCGIEIVIQ